MIYQIPYAFRSTFIGKESLFPTCTVLISRGHPCIVFHKRGTEIPPSEIVEQQLIGLNREVVILIADSADEALKKFSEFEHAKVGAIWIDSEYDPIIEMPHCPELHKNSKWEFICGELDTEAPEDLGEPGVYGMCIFEGYDAPDFCPIPKIYYIVTDEIKTELAETITDPVHPEISYRIIRAEKLAELTKKEK
ncbi:MAG: hypothetical protein NTW79_01745 [Candidatus Berkelbacteria bacterium]|nr:hypothetical protein [Candidatus Berkelbacteria bacterium]